MKEKIKDILLCIFAVILAWIVAILVLAFLPVKADAKINQKLTPVSASG